jgi:hypothetical protein
MEDPADAAGRLDGLGEVLVALGPIEVIDGDCV